MGKKRGNKWKQVPVNLKLASSLEEFGFAGIEELTNYEITRTDRAGHVRKKKVGGKKAKFDSKPRDDDFDSDGESDAGSVHIMQQRPTKRKKTNRGHKTTKKVETQHEATDAEEKSSDSDVDMSAWDNLFVPEDVLRALADLGFTSPTPIQALTLPSAIRDRMDILGAAETGSGKTLAFGIPILHRILRRREEKGGSQSKGPLSALIITPTRELAIQVKDHIEAAAKYTDIKAVVVVGGMAPQKQERLLKRKPEIVVATPGRLWELIQEGDPHLSELDSLQCLVLDEADRMAEKGHFAELSEILSLANRNEETTKKRQNFVFSATLTLLHDVPKRLLTKKKKFKLTQDAKIGSIATMVGMKEKRKVFDLSRKTGTVETLTEAKLECTTEEKDVYLYYFLCVYPGRTLVFTNSIDCVRRLKDIFELLECCPLPLHASMNQRQRLKNLDRFRANERGLLLATDVAARGLDIPGVQHVIQYDVPRTAESYVHRSGRTARAQNEGLNLTFIDQRGIAVYRKLCRTLNREQILPSFPVDGSILKGIRQRVEKARELCKLEHQRKKTATQKSWLVNAAEQLDVEIEDKELLNQISDKGQPAIQARRLKWLRKELDSLLRQQVTPRGFFSRYPTKLGQLQPLAVQGTENALSAVKKEKNDLKALQSQQRKNKTKKRKPKFRK